MNLTISVDDELLRRAREAARARGMSLQEHLRGCLRSLTGERTPEDVADELLTLMSEHGGRSGGRKIRRDEAYEGRVT